MKLTARLVHGVAFCAALIGFTSFGATTVDAKWGNIGDATSGGVATAIGYGNYNNLTLNFGVTDNICTTGIGGAGIVKIKKVTLLASSNNPSVPSIVALTQGEVTISTTDIDSSGSVNLYASDGSVYATRKAYVCTFSSDALFDTSEGIILSSTANMRISVIKPANTLFKSGDWSPAIEITGDYTPNGSMTLELQHHYSFDGTTEATSGQPLTIQGGGAAYEASGNGQALKIGASSIPYGTGILQSGEECWTISTFAKLCATEKAVVWAIGRHSDNTGYVALTTGTNGQVQVVKSASTTVMTAQTLITSDIVVGDRAEVYHLYTLTRNNNFLKLYVDGNLVGTYWGEVTLPDGRFQLGKVRGSLDNTGLVQGNDVCIDEWRLYQGEMTAAEVAALAAKFPVWPKVYDHDSVSINFIGAAKTAAGQSITDQETAGVFAVPGLVWNQLLDQGGVKIDTNSVPLKEVLKTGQTPTGVMTMDVQASNLWTAKTTSTPVSGNGRMMYGYLDDGATSGGYGAQVTINNIPYSEYTVYVYMGTDQTDSYKYSFLQVNVNGTDYPTSALESWEYMYWGDISTTHEDGSALTLTENKNFIKVTGLTSPTLAVKGYVLADEYGYWFYRCGIAGIQIVNTGTRKETSGDYVADVTKTTTWDEGNGAGLTKHGGAWKNDNTAAITLTNLASNATLTFNTAVTAAKVDLTQAAGKKLAFTATKTATIGAYDVTKSAGITSFDGSVLGASIALSGNNAKIIPGGTVDFNLGENGTMSVSGNGEKNSASIQYTLSSGTLSITGGGSKGPFNKSPFTAKGANSVLRLNVQDATGYGAMNNPVFTFEDGAEMRVAKRDTLTTPITLKNSTVRLMSGCEVGGRGLDLFNSNGNVWTIEGNSALALDPSIGSGGRRVWMRQGNWSVTVQDGGRFDVDAIIYGDTVLNKKGAGSMYFNAENEWTGGIVIQAGTVYAGNPKALGTGKVWIQDGGWLVFSLADFATVTGDTAPFNFADTASMARVTAIEDPEHPEISYDPATGKVVVDRSVFGLTGLHILSVNPKPKGFDANGHESSVVTLVNYGPEAVNLKDYKIVRTNYGKKVKATDDDIMPLLDCTVESNKTYCVYLSEDYPTASDLGGDGKTVAWFGGLMVVPNKVNPKKYPMVRLYDAAGAVVYDEVIVPCEIDDDILVEVGANTNKVVRYVVNGNTRTEIGPEVNGPYGTKDLKNDIELMNDRTNFVSTASDFTLILPVNPLKTGDTVLESNKIASVTLEYRFFDKTSMTSVFKSMTKVAKGEPGYDKNYGTQWKAVIPQTELADKAGRLLQYRVRITDQGGSVWTAPRFCHPELGYEWYGAVVEPSAATRTENLPTMLMFADSVNLVQMDKDVDNQDKSQVPYNARIAIYDTSTHSYYDNVRIDLRGNTSANFKKKSHGLRFSKVAPFTTTNPLDGKKWEVRKSSFCTEYADPTYIRQSLSFWLLNKVGSPAPFHYPVRLYLNGEFYQLAFHTERFTDELIEDVYGLNKFVYSYKNIGTFGGSTSAGGIEKKTPDDDNEKDLTVLNAYMSRYKTAASKVVTSMTEAERAALTKNAVTNFDLSAWFNYIAISKITHENDDVWANLSGYINKYDVLHNPDGNDLMAPLAYDMNLSWGQWYYGDDQSAGRCGVRPADDSFKSHPFYGGMTIRAHRVGGSEVGNGNRAYEAVFQNEKFRRLYLRRLRTLMDAWLKEPGTPKEETPFWTDYVVPFRALITANEADVTDDRTKWNYASVTSSAGAIWVWDHALTIAEGYDDLWNNYIEPRREHLYGKHSVTNEAIETGYAADKKAGIPEAQSDIASLKAKISYELVDGGVKITNGNDETVDISGWTIAGPVTVTIPNGTVLDSVQGGIPGEVYFVTNRIAWCEQHAAELTDQFIIGNVAAGTEGDDLILKTADGTIVIGEKSDQEKYLRLWGFCGAPLTGGEDGPGEFIVLTNLNPTATLDLEGANLNICKFADAWEKAKCQITFPAGSKIEAGGYLRIEKKDGLEVWTAIQNGDLKIKFLAANGASIYTMDSAALSQSGKGVKDQDKFLKAIAYNQTPDDWEAHDNSEAPVKPEPPVPPPGPGGDVITGDFPEGTNIVLTADATIKIGNANFGGPLTITGGNASIEMQPGTTAKIPTIAASGLNLTFGGAGALSMSNSTTLITCADLTVTNGTLAIDFRNGAAKASAVYLKGNFTQLGGDIALNLVSDNTVYGIQVDKKDKEAFFEGGSFTATVEGGEKSAAIKLEKGSSHANLKGGTTTVTMSGPTNRFINTEGKIKIKGDYTATIKSSGLDARVFKATKEVAIEGCVVTGEATGAGSEMFSSDDSIKVSGGVIGVTAAEDCFSAQTNVVISAGKIQLLSTGGDAIDSNGDVTIKGGYVLANTTAEGENGIEADGKLVISGGTVVAVGYKDIIHVPDTGSVGCYTSSSVKYDKDNKYIEVGGTNAVNKLICTVNLNKKCAENFSLIATCPGFLGTVSYTGTKPDTKQSYIEKLDENLDGAFLTLLDRVEPGKPTEMEAKTEEEAQKEIKKYEVVLTEEDVQAGVEPNMLKMVPQPVTNEVGAVTYYAVVAVNPEVVPAPTVGEDETGEVKPIVVTPTAGGMDVSVGIVNATQGLWYGYEVCDALSEGFANDVPSFKRADGEAITIKGSTRTGASSFFRVKVLPAQPH